MDKHLIIVESKHDKTFVEEYSSFLKINTYFTIITTDEGNPKAGKDKLPRALKQMGDSYLSISVIFDADTDFKHSQETILKYVSESANEINSIKNLLSQFSSNKIFLFPDNQSIGQLEHLLLSIAQQPDFLNCIEEYYQCLLKKNVTEAEHKLKYYSYLAAIGYSTSDKFYDGRFNLASEKLNPLKDFLKNILK